VDHSIPQLSHLIKLNFRILRVMCTDIKLNVIVLYLCKMTKDNASITWNDIIKTKQLL